MQLVGSQPFRPNSELDSKLTYFTVDTIEEVITVAHMPSSGLGAVAIGGTRDCLTVVLRD